MHLQVHLFLQQSQLASHTAALVLDLYQWPQRKTANSGLRTSADAELALARSQQSTGSSVPNAAIAALSAPAQSSSSAAGRRSVSSASSSSSNSSRSSQAGGNTSDDGSAFRNGSGAQSDTGSKQASNAAVSQSDPLKHIGRVIFPLRHLSGDTAGLVNELAGDLKGAPSGVEGELLGGSQAVVELQVWDAAAYAAEHGSAEKAADTSPGGQHAARLLCCTESLDGRRDEPCHT